MEKEMQEELVLDLPELLAMYLRKGILILACSCIFGILFASLRTLRRGEENPAVSTEEESAFDKERALEEGTANYVKTQLEREKDLALWEVKRLEDSALFQLKPDSVYERQMDLYLKLPNPVDAQGNSESIYKDRIAGREGLVEAYKTLFRSTDFYNQIASSTGNLKSSDIPDLLFLDADDKTGNISLSFAGASAEEVEKMGNAAKAYWENAAAKLGEELEPHSIVLLSDTSAQGMRVHSVLTYQNSGENVEGRGQDSILGRQEDKKASLNKRLENIKNLKDQEKSLPKETASVNLGFSKRAFAKQAILGVILGGFLSVFVFTLQYLFEKKLPREEDLESIYGFTVLGSKRRFGREGLCKSFSDKLSGDREREGDEEALLSLAKSNLSLLLKERNIAEEILFVGEDKTLLEKTVKFMNDESPYLSCSYACDIFKNEEGISKLGMYRTLVFVAAGRSDLRSLLNMKRKAETLKKEVLGLLLF